MNWKFTEVVEEERSLGEVRTVKGEKIGRAMVLELGQELGMTKFWFRALKANSRVEVVRKGRAEGSLERMFRKKPFCSPSWPMTEATPRMSPLSPSEREREVSDCGVGGGKGRMDIPIPKSVCTS